MRESTCRALTDPVVSGRVGQYWKAGLLAPRQWRPKHGASCTLEVEGR